MYEVKKGCEGCRYWRDFSKPHKGCHYLLDTGHVRGCEAGENCRVRDTRRVRLQHGLDGVCKTFDENGEVMCIEYR